MRRSRLALGAAAAAVLAVTAFTTSAVGASSPTTASPAAATSLRVPRGCNYPPQIRPTVTLAGPASVRRARNFSLTGLVRLNDCGLPRWPVALYASTQQNGVYLPVAVDTTGNGGNAGTFSFRIPGIVVPTYYRVVTLPGAGLQSATSNTVRVGVS